MAERASGSCLCGAATFTAIPGQHAHICHCGMCRKFSGGMFMVVDCGDTVEFSDRSAVSTYVSSEWGERLFCKSCGSSLAWRARDGKMTMVSMQAFDAPEAFEIESQIFVDCKPANYALANQTVMMTGEEVMAKFASLSSEGNA
ncbi:GFA family protein [Paracoccus sp. (in: a-proteobacteria)]|uniref:GFA family protein n=1 Tax=Paracoccus sp. TaxID=267 RepID=UPI002899AE72|nr:GFA family protein [Paracoccus sp. (in: a-proteobacteria)]